MRPGRLSSARRVATALATILVLAAGAAAAVVIAGGSNRGVTPARAAIAETSYASASQAAPLTRQQYLRLAEQGVARISKWWDPKLHWYLAYLRDHEKRPLGSIWDTVSTFELLDEVAIAEPTSGNRRAVQSFGDYYTHYWDPKLSPTPGYAPYPGDRGKHQTAWYDDAGWLGLAFLDADAALGSSRYLTDAERSMAFIESGGWDARQGGGMWWNTKHPWRSGEALAADADLAARLYQVTHRAQYLRLATAWIAWANKHLRQVHDVYIRTASVPYGSETYTGSGPAQPSPGGKRITLPPQCRKSKTPRRCLARACKKHKRCPKRGVRGSRGGSRHGSKPTFVAMPTDGEGAMLSAMVTLHQATHRRLWLPEAEKLARNMITWLAPFDNGPQYDGVMLRGFVTLYAQDHEPRWYRFLTSMASVITRTARTQPGVYLRNWGGGKKVPSAVPGMLRTDASSLMVLADLATVSPPAQQ